MRDTRFAKLLLVFNAAVPLALLGWDAAHGNLGANPIEFVLRSTGTLALVFLILTLAVSPARRLLGLLWLTKLRRALGLISFAYACLHVSIYVVLDQGLNPLAIVGDALTRPFIFFGMAAFGFMVPLAWTSTDAAVRRMGKRWTLLHQKVVWIAVFAGVHYYLEVKADTAKPLVFIGLLALLIFWRFVMRDVKPRPR